jgi:hypothetical protein
MRDTYTIKCERGNGSYTRRSNKRKFVNDEVDEEVSPFQQLDSSNHEEMYYPTNGSTIPVSHVQHLHGIHAYWRCVNASKYAQAHHLSGKSVDEDPVLHGRCLDWI